MTNLERYTLMTVIAFLAACAALFYGQSHAQICLQQTGPDVLVPRACTGVR